MSETENSPVEVRRLRRMLKQMYTLSEHASLTGALSEGAEDAVEQYNRIVRRLGALHIIPESLFAQLPPDASFDRLGVASKLLEGYLADEDSDNESGGHRSGGHKIIIGNSMGDMSGLEELKDIGRLIRENLPEFLRKRAEPPTPPTPPQPPVPPTPPHRSDFD